MQTSVNIPVHDGFILVTSNSDPDYPGVSIGFLKHPYNSNDTCQPAVIIEQDENNLMRTLTDEEKEFLCNIIRQGFYEYTSDEYERKNFEVKIVDSCDATWDNGKAYYVFSTSYSRNMEVKRYECTFQ